MRISGGKLKGRTLKIPKVRDIRPTQEAIRLNIFNILGELVKDRKVLDLYAGSGSLGIEALPRGAREAIFIESNKQACQAIRENITPQQISSRAKVICRDVKQSLLNFPVRDIDLVFLDPPYAIGKMDHIFQALFPLLKRGAIVIYEHAKTTEAPQIEGLRVFDHRLYGGTKVTFLTKD